MISTFSGLAAGAPAAASLVAPGTELLRRLTHLRWMLIGGVLTAATVGHLWLRVRVPLLPLVAVLGALAAYNAIVLLHLRLDRGGPAGWASGLVQLLLDVAALTALLYFTGGPTNPLVSLYLLPLSVAAGTLPLRQTWLVAAAAVLAYTLLMWQHIPLETHASHAAEYQRHVVGMWVTFVASTLVIAGVVARMAAELRRRQAELARAREDALRRDQVVALGALAAGAAHELGTPLATVAVIARELERACDPQSELADEVRTLREQADVCKSIVSTMLAAAGNARAEGGDVRPADEFVREVVEQWSLLRPSAQCRLALPRQLDAPAILAEQTLRHAVFSVLNNAADVSPEQVEVEAGWDAHDLWIEVRDRGPGLPQQAGDPFFTTKPHGRGLGLFLARSAIERLGGTLGMSNRGDGGARLRVTLPLAVLAGRTA